MAAAGAKSGVCDQYNFIRLFCLRCIWISFEAGILLPIICPRFPAACSALDTLCSLARLPLSVLVFFLHCYIKCLIKTKTMKVSLGWKENLFPLCLFVLSKGLSLEKKLVKFSAAWLFSAFPVKVSVFCYLGLGIYTLF